MKLNKKQKAAIGFAVSITMITIMFSMIFVMLYANKKLVDKIDNYTVYNETAMLELAKMNTTASYTGVFILMFFVCLGFIYLYTGLADKDYKELIK